MKIFCKLIVLLGVFWSFHISAGQVVQDPDFFHGPRTKWVIYPELPSGPECTGGCINRHSIIPQMDIGMAEWLGNLEAVGANSATINLEARRGLLSSPAHATFDLSAEQINNGEFTPYQRDRQLINFLIDVQAAINRGAVNGNIRFHVHQRLYPRRESSREQQFITDFSEFVNRAKEYGVDHLIAGIRLGEHGTDGRNYVLEFALKVVNAINENTGGWLRNKGLEMSGDEYGRMFKNIHTRALSSTFFEEISGETGYFTFCFKAFGVGGRLRDMGYDTESVSGWETGLREGLGLDDLVNFIQDHREEYPYHANVIFIGDSGDALKQIGWQEYWATTNIFTQAGDGFSGIIGVNGYRRPDKGTDDNHLYFYDAIDGTTATAKPNSIQRWQAWPFHDGDVSEHHIVLAKSGMYGTMQPAGPLKVDNGASLDFSATPWPGYEISEILVNGNPVSVSENFSIENITSSTKLQVKYRKTEAVHNVIAFSGHGGTISPSGVAGFNDGETATYSITPYPGYEVKSLLINGEEVSPRETLILEPVDKDHTVQVFFKAITSSVSDEFEDVLIDVYPVPAKSGGSVFVELDGWGMRNYSLSLFDMRGRSVSDYSPELTGTGMVLHLGNIDGGLYFLKIDIAGKSLLKKILVED
ncbi:T9SS type A sorting domain-containing protein [Marinilabilia rubra]|uniref:Secretion system C-terminal sorting domain-containing protein n=1 Tax=Marinilabilia rubra TaxID=2162893 RepID=A0A2U2BEC2_9BACT|nr:T9SS type A sorting domain-containing protein [Marinilabilia rubra]PWE01367.1 hypothetical protein DDZ16_02460 [Marinilabilia rubra]